MNNRVGSPRTLWSYQIHKLVEMYDEQGMKQVEIAAYFGVSQSTVSQVLSGRIYGDITGRVFGKIRSVRHD